jgi:hypothetical protein
MLMVGDFLIHRYSVFGVVIQNWMVLAAMVIIVALTWTAGDK